MFSRVANKHLTRPRGRLQGRCVAMKDDILQGGDSGSRPPQEGAGPLDAQTGLPCGVQNLHKCKPDPWDGSRTPQEGSGPLSVGPRDAKEKNTQALVKARQGSGADTCPNQAADAPTPRSGGGPMLPRDISPVT
jgi:hypothetical protein